MSDRGPLRERLKQKLSGVRLDDEAFERFELLLSGQGEPSANAWFRQGWSVASVAAVVATLGLALGVVFYSGGADDRPNRMAEEVVTNHVHARSLDHETGSIEELRQRLDRLDFVPVEVSTSTDEPLSLLGGRYCTLQGAIAVQMIFLTPSGARVSRYQAAYDPNRFGVLPRREESEAPLLLMQRGVEVSLWVEQGVVVAEAR